MSPSWRTRCKWTLAWATCAADLALPFTHLGIVFRAQKPFRLFGVLTLAFGDLFGFQLLVGTLEGWVSELGHRNRFGDWLAPAAT
jgi:hypothetical protein